jgi:hypothetical protein
MELSNPPLQELHIKLEGAPFHPFYIEGEGGLTFQDIIDVIVSEYIKVAGVETGLFQYFQRPLTLDLLYSLSGNTILYVHDKLQSS